MHKNIFFKNPRKNHFFPQKLGWKVEIFGIFLDEPYSSVEKPIYSSSTFNLANLGNDFLISNADKGKFRRLFSSL